MTVGTMQNFSQVSGPDMEKIVPDDRDDELNFSQVRNDRGRPRIFFPKSEMTVATTQNFSQVRINSDLGKIIDQAAIYSFPKSEMTVAATWKFFPSQNSKSDFGEIFLFWFWHAHQVPNTPWPSAKTQVKTSVFAILLSVN